MQVNDYSNMGFEVMLFYRPFQLDVMLNIKIAETIRIVDKIKKGPRKAPSIGLVLRLTGMTVSPAIFGLAPSIVFAALLGLGPTGATCFASH